MKKIISFFAFFVLVSFLLSPFISLILPDSLRDHTYREIIMHVVASEETRGLKSEAEIAKKLFFYTAKNTLVNPGGLVPYEDKALGYLINGLVYCDYASDILAVLCAHKGIPARYCMLKDKNDISPHTIVEIFLNGKWRVFDPTEVCYYTNKSGELATIEDLSHDPALIFANKRMQKIKETSPAAYVEMVENYKKIFPLPFPPQRSSSKIKRITLPDRVGFFYYFLFGNNFLKFYQNIYLKIKTRDMDKKECIYYVSRNFHLVHRSKKAIQGYSEFIKSYPEDANSDKVILFLALIYMDQKRDYLKAPNVLATLASKPGNIYQRYALYYIGKCLEFLNKKEQAQEYFNKSGMFIRLDPSLAN